MLASPLLLKLYCAFSDTACDHPEIGSYNALLEFTAYTISCSPSGAGRPALRSGCRVGSR